VLLTKTVPAMENVIVILELVSVTLVGKGQTAPVVLVLHPVSTVSGTVLLEFVHAMQDGREPTAI